MINSCYVVADVEVDRGPGDEGLAELAVGTWVGVYSTPEQAIRAGSDHWAKQRAFWTCVWCVSADGTATVLYLIGITPADIGSYGKANGYDFTSVSRLAAARAQAVGRLGVLVT